MDKFSRDQLTWMKASLSHFIVTVMSDKCSCLFCTTLNCPQFHPLRAVKDNFHGGKSSKQEATVVFCSNFSCVPPKKCFLSNQTPHKPNPSKATFLVLIRLQRCCCLYCSIQSSDQGSGFLCKAETPSYLAHSCA